MTKLIGIPVISLGENNVGLRKELLDWVSEFGIPVPLNVMEPDNFFRAYPKLDALVLPGGYDIDSRRYNQIPGWFNSKADSVLEYFDAVILPKFIKNKTPIFGICRGLQTLNVLLGGDLKQHLRSHPYADDGKEAHDVVSIADTKFKFKTNSSHHQGIGRLAPPFTVEMVSPTDKVIEAVSWWANNIFAVQWHPERSFDDYSNDMFLRILGG